jgi:hypothetical protein
MRGGADGVGNFVAGGHISVDLGRQQQQEEEQQQQEEEQQQHGSVDMTHGRGNSMTLENFQNDDPESKKMKRRPSGTPKKKEKSLSNVTSASKSKPVGVADLHSALDRMASTLTDLEANQRKRHVSGIDLQEQAGLELRMKQAAALEEQQRITDIQIRERHPELEYIVDGNGMIEKDYIVDHNGMPVVARVSVSPPATRSGVRPGDAIRLARVSSPSESGRRSSRSQQRAAMPQLWNRSLSPGPGSTNEGISKKHFAWNGEGISKKLNVPDVAKYPPNTQVGSFGDGSMDGWWVANVEADNGGRFGPGEVTLSNVPSGGAVPKDSVIGGCLPILASGRGQRAREPSREELYEDEHGKQEGSDGHGWQGGQVEYGAQEPTPDEGVLNKEILTFMSQEEGSGEGVRDNYMDSAPKREGRPSAVEIAREALSPQLEAVKTGQRNDTDQMRWEEEAKQAEMLESRVDSLADEAFALTERLRGLVVNENGHAVGLVQGAEHGGENYEGKDEDRYTDDDEEYAQDYEDEHVGTVDQLCRPRAAGSSKIPPSMMIFKGCAPNAAGGEIPQRHQGVLRASDL